MSHSRRRRANDCIVVGVIQFLVSTSPFLCPAGAQPENAGQAAFERICSGCHGTNASGDIGPPLVPFRLSNRELFAIVREGIGMMPVLSVRDISDEEVGAVAEYLRRLTPSSDRDPAQKEPKDGPEAIGSSCWGDSDRYDFESTSTLLSQLEGK